MRFLRFMLILGVTQLIVYLAVELLIFRNLDLRLIRFVQLVAIPQFEALILCLVIPRQRATSAFRSWRTTDTGWIVMSLAAVAVTLLVPGSKIMLPAVALLVAAAFFITARCVVRIVLGLLLIAAATDLIHPWIVLTFDRWLLNRDALFRDLATYGVGTIALVLTLGALERILSPEYGTAYRSLLVSVAAAMVFIDLILFNYFSHPFLSPRSATAAGVCGVLFSTSLATTAVLLRFQRRAAL